MKLIILIEKFKLKDCVRCEKTYPSTFEFFKPKRKECRACCRERTKKWTIKNKDARNKYYKQYCEDKKENINKVKREYKTKRKKVDNLYRTTVSIRNSISWSLNKRKITKKSKTYEILGCTFEEFKIHIESKFLSWMNWNNHGLYNGKLNFGWDFDHIIPISSATTEGEIIKLNHFTNFQPLCSHINRDIKK